MLEAEGTSVASKHLKVPQACQEGTDTIDTEEEQFDIFQTWLQKKFFLKDRN